MLHRLALAVECIDAVTERVVNRTLDMGRELPGLLASESSAWPCVNLVPHGPGRAIALHESQLPASVTIRIDCRTRSFVPRRFSVPLWSEHEVGMADLTGIGYVPARSRLVRPFLLPGSAYFLPRGTTAVRGRVVHANERVRWPRIVATDDSARAVGWAHGDERGEFLLVVESAGKILPPAPDTLAITFAVSAPALTTNSGGDRLAGMPVESISRTPVPTPSNALDSALLRGRTIPKDNLTSKKQPTATVPVGELTTLHTPIPFAL